MGTLTIYFTPVTPAPANGYIIKYAVVGSTNFTTISSTTSPVIVQVNDVDDYYGFVASDCGNGRTGEEISWSSVATTTTTTIAVSTTS